MSSRTLTMARLVVPTGVAVVVVALAMPAVTATTWADILGTLSGVNPLALCGLTAMWLAGLVAQTPSLTAALPGLSHRRALALNLAGSCVSNLLPLGGAAVTAVNWRMARGWGFGGAAFARWALITNLADTVVKLALPAAVLGWFALSADVSPRVVGTAALAGGALLVLLGGLMVVASREAMLRRVGGWLDLCANRIPVLPRSPEGYAANAVRFRAESSDLVAVGWPRLIGGKLAYAILQAVLLWGCLAAVGVRPPLVVVAAAFVVERALSMLVLTPGAVGPVEVGMVAALTALAVPAGGAAGGVLLYRAFIVALEVPVGGAILLGWWAQRHPLTRMPWRVTPVRAPTSTAQTSLVSTRSPL